MPAGAADFCATASGNGDSSLERRVRALHAEDNLLGTVLYLMCDDLPSFVKSLQAKNVQCTEIEEAGWGIKTTIKLPSGGEIGLYQPKHPTAINLS